MAEISVSNLKIVLEQGTLNAYRAQFNFTPPSNVKSMDVAEYKIGSRVTIDAGATSYNGGTVKSEYYSLVWYITQVNGEKIKLGGNTTTSAKLDAWFNINDLTIDGEASSSAAVNPLDHFKYRWDYSADGSNWFKETTVDEKTVKAWTDVNAYTPPENAAKIRITVFPVSKKKSNGSAYFTGKSAIATFDLSNSYPEAISDPTFEVTQDTWIVMSNEGITDPRTDAVQYELYEVFLDGTSRRCFSLTVDVKFGAASHMRNVGYGRKFRVRCRAINKNGSATIADANGWTAFTSIVTTAPAAPTNLKAKTERYNNILLTWEPPHKGIAPDMSIGIPGGSDPYGPSELAMLEYDIEYAEKKEYFDNNREAVTSITVIGTTSKYIENVNSGTYFFRVRCRNDSGASRWTVPVKSSLGQKPDPPNIWVNKNSTVFGESVTVFWQPNHKDGSEQQKVKINYAIEGSGTWHVIKIDDTEKIASEKTYKYTFDTGTFAANANLKISVATAGVLEDLTISGSDKYVYSNNSETLSVKIYSRPALSIAPVGQDPSSTDTHILFKHFPIGISINSSYDNTTYTSWIQKPMAYNIQLISLENYDTTDQLGREVSVSAGDILYNTSIDRSAYSFIHRITPDMLRTTLVSGATYQVKCSVSMSSGLTAEDDFIFEDGMVSSDYYVTCDVEFNKNIAMSDITASAWTYNETTNKTIYPRNLQLDVYRINYDGSYTHINDMPMVNSGSATVRDPHPAFNVAAYRVVATNPETGSISFSDNVYEYDSENRYIYGRIDWDEDERLARTGEGDAHIMGWESSEPMPDWDSISFQLNSIDIKWNLDITENVEIENKLVSYAGREDPVSYYGTHTSTTSSWSFDIVKTDRDTLERLRRLSKWHGPVYIREPSGLGYWANIKVNINQTHDSVVTKVKFDITKVEGGK